MLKILPDITAVLCNQLPVRIHRHVTSPRDSGSIMTIHTLRLSTKSNSRSKSSGEWLWLYIARMMAYVFFLLTIALKKTRTFCLMSYNDTKLDFTNSVDEYLGKKGQ